MGSFPGVSLWQWNERTICQSKNKVSWRCLAVKNGQIIQCMVSAKVTGLQLVVSDQSGSRLKECPRMADPDQQMVTAPGSPHHPAADVTDPSPATSCFSWCVWWWHFPLRLSLPFHSTPHTFRRETVDQWHALMCFFYWCNGNKTYFLKQALLFRRLASYTCRWTGRRGCSSCGKALRRALLFLAAVLIQRSEQCQRCSANLQQNIHT